MLTVDHSLAHHIEIGISQCNSQWISVYFIEEKEEKEKNLVKLISLLAVSAGKEKKKNKPQNKTKQTKHKQTNNKKHLRTE